jgi:DNA-binding SARP family transcriptional activator
MADCDEHRGLPPSRLSRRRTSYPLTPAIVLTLAFATQGLAADLAEVESHFRAGRYDEAAKLAGQETASGSWIERWHLLKVRSELAQGLYPAAQTSLEDGLRRLPGSVALLLLGRDVYHLNGKDAEADGMLDAIEARIESAPSRYSTPEGRVLLGRFYLLRKVDAKKVLDLCYDLALKRAPDLVEAYYATAELALDKQDGALAATTLAKAPKVALEDPRTHYLLARAFDEDDRARSEKELDEALKINPHHVESLLLRVAHRIDDERYADASELLKQIFAVNPQEPRGWAYQAVLAHLRSHPEGEAAARTKALASWKTNPEVDHIIGRELSAKYRFLEGSGYQKKALEIDPEYLPAKVQLCQDLLRLGLEDEGWKLADEVFAQDGYNVLAYNLTNLRDRLAGFKTLKDDGFLVRMDPREADLYGPRVLALLRKARKTLGEKYGATIPGPVTVEIFPQKKEFAVRTFGLPGAEGFLGVCFGSVITANSPASQGENPSNWEAVLWHEYCHVVTLNKTKNKMPRWLSEGISVYEEANENPAWKSALTPRYRAMILGEDFTPLSRLSSAFLAPKSGMHVQFAYFESALAVEFLVEKAGLPALREILDDLGAGVTINESLPNRSKMTLEQLDADFAAFARKKAEALASGMTWEDPELPPTADSKAIEAWLEKHPTSYPGLKRLAAKLVTEGNWPKAKETIARLKTAYPDDSGPDNADLLLAAVCRKMSDPAGERAALEALASRDGDAGPAYLRLMEIEEAAGDWNGLANDARRMLAVNPLVTTPHRELARAAEKLGQEAEALAAYRALALLDETDPADTHYRLAKLLAKLGQPVEARREVLKSLEAAPRFLEAHRLLLELVGTAKPDSSPPPARRR